MIDKIKKYCEYCQKFGQAPRRMKIRVNREVHFNSKVYIDIFYININGKATPVVHVIDEATGFQNCRILKDMKARTVFAAVKECWIDTYLGSPDMFVTDAGTNFDSKEFHSEVAGLGSSIKVVGVEGHNSIGKVERYHWPVKRVYYILCEEMPNMSPADRLQMAVKAVNDTAGPDGLTPTLLVFGAFPRMVEKDLPAAELSQRSKAMRKAMNTVLEIHAERQVTDALRMRNGPDTTAVKATTTTLISSRIG